LLAPTTLAGTRDAFYRRRMPELPEVETVRRELAPWLEGRTIREARRVDAPAGPKYLHLEDAVGQTIRAVDRRGKFLILPLSGSDELIIHLGMTGVLTPTRPDRHVRAMISLEPLAEQPDALYFQDTRRFGRFLVAPYGDRSCLPTLARMGPEPLDPEFNAATLFAGLNSRVTIKTHLLSQRPVAGLGNIYVDEALWRARIHPETPANAVSQARTTTLTEAIVAVLQASLASRGTTLKDYRTTTGERGGFAAQLDAYGRTDAPCHRCETPIRRTVLGQRSTHYCPRCQRRAKRPTRRT
jgi:formamidopyrimidine-DNA glycosylase